MTKHVHSFERHPLAGPTDYSVDWRPWPEEIRAYICRCGEPGFEVPEVVLTRIAEREVDEYRAERTSRDAEMEAEESAEQEERG